MGDPLRLTPLFVAYLRRVQCRHCMTDVFWCDNDAIAEAEYQIECCGCRSIADLRDNLNRTCSACSHMMNKDD
jgi:hypothetical protein